MAKLIATIALTAASFGISIYIMEAGWGLDPVSWTPIVGGFVVQMILYILIVAL